jgi:tetratricopeptide (TPR) repeat protein
VTESSGYALRISDDAVDAWRFERLVTEGMRLLPNSPDAAAARFADALSEWRGIAYADYRDEPWAEGEIARLTELRSVALEQSMAARLESGEVALLVPELQALVTAEPLREERWRLLTLAYYRCGRQADALAALRQARAVLAEELGIDPGATLQQLEVDVLAQAPSLQARAPRLHSMQSTPPARQAPTPPIERVTETDPLVERSRELSLMNVALDEALSGQGLLALVTGPAGIGKSRLLREARDHAQAKGLRVLHARGSDLERDFAFGVVRQLFEPVLRSTGRSDELLTGAAAAAGPVFGLGPPLAAGGDDGVFAALHGLYWLTVELVDAGPLAIVIDDLHWCDVGSLRYLAYLVRRLEGIPLLVLAAERTGESYAGGELVAELSQDPRTVLIQPGPLTADGTAELARLRLGPDVAESFARACHETTSGNPLLLRQLLRALEAEDLRPDGAHADVVRAIGSRAISSMVMLRLRRLPASALAVARGLAVLGDGAGLPEVAVLADLPEQDVAAATEALARAEIVPYDPPLRFVHALVRDAVYGDLSPGERELQHERAAQLLDERGAAADQVAAQLMHAPRRGNTWAVSVLRRAAADAQRRGTYDGAVSYMRRALEEPPPAAERPEVLFELGRVETSGEGPAALQHLSEAYDVLPVGPQRAQTAQMLARTMLFAAPPGTATRFAARAAAELPPELADDRQALLALKRMAGHMNGLDPAIWGFAEPAEIAGTGPGARMLMTALAWEGVCQCRPADEVARLAERALDNEVLLQADIGLFGVVNTVALELADRDVLPTLDRALAISHERGSLFSALAVHLWRGFALFRRGDLAEAEAALQTSREQMDMWRAVTGAGYVDALVCRLRLERDDLDGALRAASAGEAPNGTDGYRLQMEAKAHALLAAGQIAASLAILDGIEDLLPHIVNPAWRFAFDVRARALAAAGRQDEALALLDSQLELARRWGAASLLGRFLLVRGRIAGQRGMQDLEEAEALLAASHTRLEHGKALAALGVARSASHPDEGRALLRRAMDIADSCGGLRLRKAVAAELSARGEDVPSAPYDGAAALTTTERRVLALTDEGADAREIAQALFVTPGSVERHLAEARRKLSGG